MIIIEPRNIVHLNWQLLINELRLTGNKVSVSDARYNGDEADEAPTLIVTDGVINTSIGVYRITERRVGDQAREIDEIANTKIYRTLPFSIDKAIQMYKDKPVQLVREILEIKHRVIIFKGLDCVLIMKDTGNEYTQMPSALKRLANLGAATKVIIGSGFGTIDKGPRLDACNKCPYLSGPDCLVCGCIVEIKAGYQSMNCPKGRWP